MAYSLIGSGVSGVGSTSAYDTTGANLIVLFSAMDVTTDTVNDGGANTFSGLTPKQAGGSDTTGRIWYKYSPTTSATHVFNCSISYGAIFALAFTGALSGPFDVENGSTQLGVTAIAGGSITPNVDNELIISGLANGNATSAYGISGGGFSVVTLSLNAVVGVNYGGALSYLVQTTASATNPTYAWTGAANASHCNGSFKPAIGGGASILRQMMQHHHYRQPHKRTDAGLVFPTHREVLTYRKAA